MSSAPATSSTVRPISPYADSMSCTRSVESSPPSRVSHFRPSCPRFRRIHDGGRSSPSSAPSSEVSSPSLSPAFHVRTLSDASRATTEITTSSPSSALCRAFAPEPSGSVKTPM